MDQGSNAWLLWRNEGIGSSDAPSIMGVGYKTPHQVYQEKVTKKIEQSGNQYIFEKGHQVEKKARALLEIQHGGVEYRAGLLQMIDYPFLRASMDGANFELSEGKEFKLVSLKEFNEGVCPVRYYPQIMHQYLVSGLKKIDIVLCCEVGKLKQLRIKEIEVPLDLEYIHNKLVPTLFDFWWRVQNKVPPDLKPGDAIRIKDKKVIEKIKRYEASLKKLSKLKNEIAKIESGLPYVLDDICTQMPDDYMYYNKKLYHRVKTVRVNVTNLW